jgi:hypothetical protein
MTESSSGGGSGSGSSGTATASPRTCTAVRPGRPPTQLWQPEQKDEWGQTGAPAEPGQSAGPAARRPPHERRTPACRRLAQSQCPGCCCASGGARPWPTAAACRWPAAADFSPWGGASTRATLAWRGTHYSAVAPRTLRDH